jgi:hypothetical protein
MRVERWFMYSLDQLGVAYRRRMQIVAIIVSITVATMLNLDSAAITNALWVNPTIREVIVAQANQVQELTQQNPSSNIKDTLDQLSALSLPIGWSADNLPNSASGWVAKIAGLLISGIAGAQAASYWYDLMRKLLSRN